MSWDSKTELVLDHCMDTFGVGATGKFTYLPSKGSPFECRGIFDNAYQVVDPNTEAQVSSIHPMLGVKLSDLPCSPKSDDKVIVREIKYRIIDVQKDVHGGASLILQKI